MEVSKVPIFRAIWTISSLSMPTTGPQDGQVDHGAGDQHGVHGLAGHLAQALAGDQGLGAAPLGHRLGDAHHEAAHEHGEQLLRAGAAQLLLDGGEGHHVDGEPSAPGGEQLGQLSTFCLASWEV